MIPSMQPSRPKLPSQPTHIQQQRRTTHSPPQPQPAQQQQQPTHTHAPPGSSQGSKPKSQIEAMPPTRTPPMSLSAPAKSAYDAATRHPVFFTSSLRKLPFPMPQVGSAGWSPVASGYVLERERGRGQGGVGTKL
ncbi:hypothetical protein B5807_11242 [Epicoccum nigrum]|uniref:Uncharacterized protein n=1 Tax=Epicoccum nigrum TaxID=105696 RepID=A0A1Y2LMQ9_EPING|nr:hypothetical protein B5807_11242 [Epicoccum nigrum]